MGAFRIEVAYRDAAVCERRYPDAQLADAASAAFDLAKELEQRDRPDEPAARWIKVYEGDRLEIAISVMAWAQTAGQADRRS